jgi:hypothetical protein
MSDEVNELKDDITSSVSKFMSAPRIKEAFSAASTGLKVAGGALALGLLWKPALLLAAAAAVYSGVKGYESYSEYKEPGDGSGGPSAKPDDLSI